MLVLSDERCEIETKKKIARRRWEGKEVRDYETSQERLKVKAKGNAQDVGKGKRKGEGGRRDEKGKRQVKLKEEEEGRGLVGRS